MISGALARCFPAGVIADCGRARPAPPISLLLVTALAFAAGGAPLRAADLLGPDQLDTITAGKVTATALAHAFALGPNSETSTSTDVSARREQIGVYVLQRVNGRVVVARKGEAQVIEVGFARAEASASGGDPRVDCTANVRFSAQPSVRLVESVRDVQSRTANCLCAAFGYTVLGN